MTFADRFNPYAWIMRLRRRLYREGTLRSVSIGTPVISVGNLSAGGTGKTPFTMHLVRLLHERYDLKCAVVLRGYKRESSGFLVVRDWNEIKANVRRSGDEAQLFARRLTNTLVICDENRVNGARMAREMGAGAIVLDDGYQHLRLARDLNILLINALEGIPAVMPFGHGREVAEAMWDADLIVVTNFGDTSDSLLRSVRSNANCPVVVASTRISQIRPIGAASDASASIDLRGKTVLAVSAIATPEGFERSLEPLVGRLVPLRYADHATYSAEIVAEIEQTARESGCDAIVTTTKDEVKLLPLRASLAADIPVFVAESELELADPTQEFTSLLDRLFVPNQR